MIEIKHLSDCVGASKYGTCSGCLRGTSEVDSMISISFLTGTTVCLCEKCRRELYECLKEDEDVSKD